MAARICLMALMSDQSFIAVAFPSLCVMMPSVAGLSLKDLSCLASDEVVVISVPVADPEVETLGVLDLM